MCVCVCVCMCKTYACVYVCSVTELCPNLCDPMDCSPPGSSVHRILQARILEWVAISCSRISSRPRNRTQVSCIAGRVFTTWPTRKALKTKETVAHFLVGLQILVPPLAHCPSASLWPTVLTFKKENVIHFMECLRWLNWSTFWKVPKAWHILLLSRFSFVGLCATPETAAHQSPWSLGFSR